MLNTARQWGELRESVPDACANIVKNPRRPVARYLNREELNRLGTVLDRYEQDRPWPVAAIRLLTLTGARLSEVLNLRWDEIGDVSEAGSSARLTDSRPARAPSGSVRTPPNSSRACLAMHTRFGSFPKL